TLPTRIALLYSYPSPPRFRLFPAFRLQLFEISLCCLVRAGLLDNGASLLDKVALLANCQRKALPNTDGTVYLPGATIAFVFSFRSRPMVRKKSSGKVSVSRASILRAVASSSAIETGERTEVIEKRLKSRKSQNRALT